MCTGKRQTHIRSAPSPRTAVTGINPYNGFKNSVGSIELLQILRERAKKTEKCSCIDGHLIYYSTPRHKRTAFLSAAQDGRAAAGEAGHCGADAAAGAAQVDVVEAEAGLTAVVDRDRKSVV